MQSVVVVDDRLLLAVLAGIAPDEITLAAQSGEVFTTGSWYYRMARAISDPSTHGVFSRAIEALPSARQARVLGAIDKLPDDIGLLSLRHLVPVIADFDAGSHLNLLAAEAVAAAYVLKARIIVTTDAPLIAKASEQLDIDYGVLTL
jgi:hypothetical protein